jgi:tRNA-specific 2-thiouridylase
MSRPGAEEAGRRVVVAMSGGVDSSVAAAVLVERGHEVIGVTLQLWPCESTTAPGSCCGGDGISAARAAADQLGIPHHVIDCREHFASRILRPAWEEYAGGRTPNPCVACNREIKFGLLSSEAAQRYSAQIVATGHHARIERRDGMPALLRGRDPGKDQSYFLHSLTVEQLARTLLPVGSLTKDAVRDLARDLRLPNAERRESQDACIGSDEAGFAETLRQRLGHAMPAGAILDIAGRRLGTHAGVHHFTVGQRRGLGVALGRPAYVVRIDSERAEVVVSDDPDHLKAGGLVAGRVNWLVPREEDPLEAEVQIRYRHTPVPARVTVEQNSNTALVHFHEPQRAVTPGQAVVFYRGERVIGGGSIERTTE